ncbi:MAG: cellulase family glycosylhydrolase [Bacteroidetes bacterium]|nr:cellulase family glycosylhydrolase [Bacteroidota bacterium]MBS1649033.1 cellulase family glycosylhydrolase [Bacteroidota bacterium]
MKLYLFFAFLICTQFLYSKPVTDTLPFGINLAGAEFGQTNMPGIYNTDYTYPTVATIDYFASKGFKLFRLPFRWERIQHAMGAELDTAELNRLTAFTDTCATRGIQVILDMHNYGKYRIGNTEYPIGLGQPGDTITKAYFGNVWRKLADVFKTRNNIYGYGIMNQPDSMPYYTWVLAAQECIDSIRTTDRKTSILIDGQKRSLAECWSICNSLLGKLYDTYNNIIFSAHNFFDKDGVGNYTTTSYDSLEADVLTGIKRAKPFVEWLKVNNKKGFISSYGVPNNDPRWLTVLDTFMNYISTNCINGSYWAAGEWWNNYSLSVQPDVNGDKVQMQVLTKYLTTSCTSINTPGTVLPQVYFYPNPFTSSITIDQGNCNTYTSVSIFDATGRKVYSNLIHSNKNIININNLLSGIYIVILRTNDNQTYTQKIMRLK